MASTTVTAPNGDRWTVQYRTGVQRKRTGLGNASGVAAGRYVLGILAARSDDGRSVRCAACGVRCGVGRGTVVDGWAVAAAEGDRAVADLPGWTVEGGRTPYAEATVVPTCPLHNGDQGARADMTEAQRHALETAVRHALDTYGERA